MCIASIFSFLFFLLDLRYAFFLFEVVVLVSIMNKCTGRMYASHSSKLILAKLLTFFCLLFLGSAVVIVVFNPFF